MSAYYPPTADALIGGNWATIPSSLSSDFYTVIDDPVTANKTDDVLQHAAAGGGTGADRVFFTFPFPYGTDYSDAGLHAVQIASIGTGGLILAIYARTYFTGTDVSMEFLLRRDGAITSLSTFTVASGAFVSGAQGAWARYSLTLTTDPLTGGLWDATTLLTDQFGFGKAAIAGNTLQVSSFGVSADERLNPPEMRARLRVPTHEVAMFCAICSLPFARSKLILVTDPLHPHVGRLVCDADYDDYYPPYEPPPVVEGDIDHEQR